MTGKCSCANSGGTRGKGFYNASKWGLIVCFSDGYHDVDITSTVSMWNSDGEDQELQTCQECPPCADCTSHIPKFRDGYISEGQMAHVWPPAGAFEADLQTLLWQDRNESKRFVFGFLCDEENALSVNTTAQFGYPTTALANTRCPGYNITASNISCPLGYEGLFCESCVFNNRPDTAFHRNGTDGTCAPCNDDFSTYGIITISGATLTLVLILVVRCCKTRRARTAQLNAKRKPDPADDAADDKAPAKTPGFCHNWSLEEEGDDDDDDDDDGCCSGLCAEDRKEFWKDVYRSCKVPVRLVVTYLQVAGQLGRVYHTTYPPMVQSVLGFIAPVHDFFGILFSAECVRLGGFRWKWGLRVVVFPLLLFILALVELLFMWITARVTIQRRKWVAGGRAEAWATFKQRLLLLIFLVYPTVVNICFGALNCRTVSPHVEILGDDDRIVCTDARGLYWASLAVIIVFGGCMPVGFGLLILYKHTHVDVDDITKNDPRVASVLLESEGQKKHRQLAEVAATVRQVRALDNYKFLTNAYNPATPYWESIDLLRKLFLVGLVVLVGRGSEAQIAAGNATSFLFFAAHMKVWPMKTDWDNYLRATCEIHVLMTITVAFVLKGDLSHEIVHRGFYDWVIIISGTLCVPVPFVVCVVMKMRKMTRLKSDEELQTAYKRFSSGLTSPEDRRILDREFGGSGRSSHLSEAEGSGSGGSGFEGGGAAPPPHHDRPQPEPEPEPHDGNELEEPLFNS